MSRAIEVCLCTHNPRRDVLSIVLSAIARQTLSRDRFGLLVVDNCSTPPLELKDLPEVLGLDVRVVRESRLGNAFARARAIRESTAPVIAFVDDDNELDPEYLERGLQILESHSELGIIGGKLLRGPQVTVPDWLESRRGYLGIHDDFGEQPIESLVFRDWEPADVPTAGMLVRSTIARRYLEFSNHFGRLGRVGGERLGSCEDMLLTRQAAGAGFKCAYRPELVLTHHIDPRRFRLKYLIRFFHGQGRSMAKLDRILGYDSDPSRRLETTRRHVHQAVEELRTADWRARVCIWSREVGWIRGQWLP